MSLRDSYVISFWVRHVLLVELLKLLINTVHYRRRCRVCNCLNCVHNCEEHSLLDFISAVQHMKYFMYNFTFIPYGLIRTHKQSAHNVSGFMSQLVRASHRCCEVTGSNPVKVLSFPFNMQLPKLRSYLRGS